MDYFRIQHRDEPIILRYAELALVESQPNGSNVKLRQR
jgi:hypothetical protein